jgi:hypothetical protein
MAPRARFELATLRLTVAAHALTIKYDCFAMLLILRASPRDFRLAALLPFATEIDLGWAQNWAHQKSPGYATSGEQNKTGNRILSGHPNPAI